jgi:4-diphosphocytidyl-2-C-methyl-D-erythritol kinase
VIAERAYAKVNLVLRVGAPRPDGLHPICSLFASLDLADEVLVAPAERDEVVCAGVEGDNLATAALSAFREAAPQAELPPLRVDIGKRIPVAAGLAGGSADAAAVLRAANEIAGSPLTVEGLRGVAARLGSDVPSQVDPRHALVTGVGEVVEPVDLPEMTLVLAPRSEGLSTAAVYAELDRIGGHAEELDPAPLRRLAAGSAESVAAGLTNDLERAALSLRPELGESIEELLAAGALGARVTGSGPTTFGIFATRELAERAAERMPPGAIVAEARR